jgi:periplasmic divalent cation tolerance protein
MEIRLLYATCATEDEARTIAEALVEARFAACCNLIPGMTSLYRWQGKIEQARECVLIVKTRADLVDRATDMIKMKHSYTVPCVLPIYVPEGGNSDYLAWLRAESA